ncbi:two-component sensor histidine kinase [Antricoccus suffuscus]|uniref:histidine kinase n=1 Tax=Antricoccus suffuscus TaxID=1629062 RepID=A0A2T1A407_9ACTN|nr:sensor histidine kinase [Antricoccus suffuscus]PRZ43350.1 two-component sensor histidine kinase [Antricoccus suffuscus]
MSVLTELVVAHTGLDHESSEHLQLLVGEWQLLADLSFSDLLLLAPTADGRMICLAQVRATTAPTVYPDDLVGSYASAADTATCERVRRTGAPIRDRVTFFPVRRAPDSEVIAVVSRKGSTREQQSSSQLEVAYLESATTLLSMVADGSFPPDNASTELLTGPRAGDGLVLLDETGMVKYASPNAMSAYRRMGVTTDLKGAAFISLTRSLVHDRFDSEEMEHRLRAALDGLSPLRIEVDVQGATVLYRALALSTHRRPSGALVLLRDVTDIRRRDRQLLSKDATIREIHHRVKNNLQTVAALLRLQARRVSTPAGKAALNESVRRVSSIALVHETLSMSLDETVDFDGIVDRLIPMVTDVASPAAAGSGVTVRRGSSFGILPADTATPLVMVLAELLQNAVEHAFKSTPVGEFGQVVVQCSRRPGQLTVSVTDNGSGLPADFSLENSDRLGLQIVRTLVAGELRGSISVQTNSERHGTTATLEIPLRRRTDSRPPSEPGGQQKMRPA